MRQSGKENIYKIYVGSFLGADHLLRILEEALNIVNAFLSVDSAAPVPSKKNL